MVDCPGHFGHIELAQPVFHPGLLDGVRKILKVTCYNCSRILIERAEDRQNYSKIIYPKQRFYKVLEHVERTFKRRCDSENGGCGFIQPKYLRRSLEITLQHFDPNA
jgi:DNA-directed RNA polymerase II subunit RPB1